MPRRSSKFTDSNLKLFYGNLLSHYKECTKQRATSDVNTVYRELFIATQYTVESPQGSLYHLEGREKEKVYAALHTIFYALPLFNRLPPDKQRYFNPPTPQYNALIIPQYIYNCSDATVFDWVSLNRNLNPYLPYLKQDNSQEGTTMTVNTANGMFAGLAIITLFFSVAVLTLLAWYYLLNQLLNSIERLWYNEGWLRAVLMSAAAITVSSISTSLTLVFASAPIMTIAFLAGFNPITSLAVSGFVVASIGASSGALLMNSLHDFIEQKTHTKSIDSLDPYRFTLTADEEEGLLVKHLDPLKVRCALVALRVEMNQVLNQETHTPSFLSRHLGSKKSNEAHSLLQRVRALRRGELAGVVIGDLNFDCRFYTCAGEYNTLRSFSSTLFAQIEPISVGYIPPTPPALSPNQVRLSA